MEKETVLILGGTSGLGRAYAIKVLAQGKRPVIVGRTAVGAHGDAALKGAAFIQADIGALCDHAAILETVSGDPEHAPSQVVWCAGTYHRGPMAEMPTDTMLRMTRVHWLGPIAFLGAFHKRMLASPAKRPYDLVVIGSVLAHVPGRNHAVLSGLKAAKVHFTRVFSQELTRDLPGSMTFVINPWGMKTAFFVGTDTKTDSFMEPEYVAGVIAEQVANAPREASLAGKGVWPVEVTLDREKDGSTKVLLGPQPPKC